MLLFKEEYSNNLFRHLCGNIQKWCFGRVWPEAHNFKSWTQSRKAAGIAAKVLSFSTPQRKELKVVLLYNTKCTDESTE